MKLKLEERRGRKGKGRGRKGEKERRLLHFVSSSRATAPDTIGAEALVPIKSSTQPSLGEVVTWKQTPTLLNRKLKFQIKLTTSLS